MKPILWDSSEIDPFTGQVYTWDSTNPNLTFDGVLEEGDAGWVPPPIISTTDKQPKKPHKMKRNSFYPTNVPEQILWLINLYLKLTAHAPTLGISTLLCAATIADARWLIYVLGSWQPAHRAWTKACTDAVREAQLSGSNVLMVLPIFVPPPLPVADPAPGGLPAVVAVNTGALNRIFGAVKTMKLAGAFTEAIGTDLGVIGTETAIPDFAMLKPTITATINGQNTDIGWGWDGDGEFLDMLELQVDRGQGWVPLAFDTTPGYTDTTPHPATPTKWKYRAIYRVDDGQVGLWSAEASITVGG